MFKDSLLDNLVSLSNTPAGNDDNWLKDISRRVKLIRLSNIPLGNDFTTDCCLNTD